MTPPAARKLRKELGLFDVYAICTGAMFSSGFFLLPGLAAAQTGPSVPLAYLVAGLFIMPPMLCVAELATAMPRAGGAYYFLDRSMGPWMGTVGGLGTWLALVLKSAFALLGMGAYLAIYFDVPIEPLAMGLTLVFMVINIVGAKETSGLQRLLVGALLVVMVLFLVTGLAEVWTRSPARLATERFSPLFPFGFGSFMATVGFVFVSYAGLTKVASVSEEIMDPERNIPLGMMLSLATAALVYGVGVMIMVAVLPPEELRQDLTPVATAAGAIRGLTGGTGEALIVMAALAAFASTGNAGLLSASRYPLAMARDRLMPHQLAALGRFRTPVGAIVATTALMMVAIALLPLEDVAKLASAFQLLLFSLLSLAVVIMRESGIEGYDPGYRSPWYPWLHIVGIVAPIWLIAQLGQLAVLFTLGLIALTTGWYLHYAAPRVERSGAIFHAFHRLGSRRTTALDAELRYIVKEKGLRAGDSFREIVAKADVLDLHEPADFERLARLAAERLARSTRTEEARLREGFLAEFDAGLVPVGRGIALPHLRLPGLSSPTVLLARCRKGLLVPKRPDGLQNGTIRAVIFLLSPEGEHNQHLRLLGHLATLSEQDDFMARWDAAPDERGLRASLLDGEHILTLAAEADGEIGAWIGRPLESLGLPRGTLVALIRRGEETIVPRGATTIEAGDLITVIGQPDGIRSLEARLLAGDEAVPPVVPSAPAGSGASPGSS